MKTLTICGSMRFAEQMKQIAWKLEAEQGVNVLQCVYNECNDFISDDTLKHLTLAHYKKIDLSDAVYVVNIDGYIGASAEQEILYAKEHGKEIIYHTAQP